MAQLGTRAVGATPAELAVTLDGRLLLVVDLASKRVTATFAVGKAPRKMAVAP